MAYIYISVLLHGLYVYIRISIYVYSVQYVYYGCQGWFKPARVRTENSFVNAYVLNFCGHGNFVPLMIFVYFRGNLNIFFAKMNGFVPTLLYCRYCRHVGSVVRFNRVCPCPAGCAVNVNWKHFEEGNGSGSFFWPDPDSKQSKFFSASQFCLYLIKFKHKIIYVVEGCYGTV